MARPTRVTSVTGGAASGERNYGYDAVGNQTTRSRLTFSYNELNLPASILDPAGTVRAQFLYGPEGNRVRKSTQNQVTTYVGGMYEAVRSATGTEHRLLVPGLAVVPYDQAAGSQAVVKKSVRYLHTDHLGSTDTVTFDAAVPGASKPKASVKERRSYDAFGLTRNPSWLSDSYDGVEAASVTEGFTGHDDDAELGLINMGGASTTRCCRAS